MAMIKCPECGKEISEYAEKCPNCGYPIKELGNQANDIQDSFENQSYRTNYNINRKPLNNGLKRNKRKSGYIMYAVIVLASFSIVSSIISGNDEDTYPSSTSSGQSVSESESEIVSQNSIEMDLTAENDTFNTGEYLFITNEDLDKYCVNLDGIKVYTVITVDDVKNNKIQSTLSDGYMMSSFDVGDNFSKYESNIERDDTVAILGTVVGNNDYSFVGNSVELEQCMVFATGDEANSYKKDQTDEGLSQYLVVTDEVANQNDDISEEEYKSLCESLDYEDILRNPDSYDGKYCIVSGTVDQVIEGFLDTYTIYVEDSSGNRWQCSYYYKDGESRLLEGDSVTFYGQCDGTTNSTTVLGEQVTLPDIDAEYLN